MDVSVIIINYNTKELTDNCIKSIIQKTEGINYEIILVDNGSTDGSKEFFQFYAGVIFIESNQNIGFARANNLGLLYARGKYIFCLNSDTLLLNNAIKFFFDEMEVNNMACLGSLLLKKDGKTIGHSFGKFPSIKVLLKTLYCIYLKKVYTDNHFDYITGADLFIRKSVIEKYGFYDSDFFLYYEETEMQYRFKKNGCNFALIATPQIIHLEGASNGYTSLQKQLRNVHSMFLYFNKTHGLAYNIIIRIVILLFLPIWLKKVKTVNDIKLILKALLH